jgi:hypothetical protein
LHLDIFITAWYHRAHEQMPTIATLNKPFQPPSSFGKPSATKAPFVRELYRLRSRPHSQLVEPAYLFFARTRDEPRGEYLAKCRIIIPPS